MGKKSDSKKFVYEQDNNTLEKTSHKKMKSKTKKKKKLHYYGPVEFAFNFISLVIAICVGLYFGGRSFYYYSLQNQSNKETFMTLNGLILSNNKIVKGESDGFHQDENGYVFRGDVSNNYVWFANRMFRIIRLNNDNTVKLVTDDLVASFMWGEDTSYEKSNLKVWQNPTDENKVSGVYYKTIPSPERFITKTKYTIDRLEDNKIERGDIEFEDYVVSLTLNDYVEAGGKSSYLSNNKLFFLLGYNSSDEILYVEEDGSIMNCDSLDGYGIRSVITMNKNIPVLQGDGTKDNPYTIDQGTDTNFVDSYVKLGDDTWKVFEDNDGNLKMYLNGYIMSNGQEYIRNYSNYSNKLDYFAEDNIGNYLLYSYYENLPYKDQIIKNKYPYGEISAEAGFYYPNVYSEVYDYYIGMLNIFDYVSNNELSNFFRDNTGASMSTTQYSILENGLLEEADVRDQKHIVPVISIKSSSIKSGTGRMDDPYVLE